jgi:hypothetical protein
MNLDFAAVSLEYSTFWSLTKSAERNEVVQDLSRRRVRVYLMTSFLLPLLLLLAFSVIPRTKEPPGLKVSVHEGFMFSVLELWVIYGNSQCCSVPCSCVFLPETVFTKPYNCRSKWWPYDSGASVSLFKNASCWIASFLNYRHCKGGISKLLSLHNLLLGIRLIIIVIIILYCKLWWRNTNLNLRYALMLCYIVLHVFIFCLIIVHFVLYWLNIVCHVFSCLCLFLLL